MWGLAPKSTLKKAVWLKLIEAEVQQTQDRAGAKPGAGCSGGSACSGDVASSDVGRGLCFEQWGHQFGGCV